MRMFWACTHAMLRISEFPLFSEMGFEVIPEEVNPTVIHYLEGVKYDLPDAPINRLWREKCTLHVDDLNSIARSRIWERDGEVSPEEAKLFNRNIDVIYVPTRLDLAVKISRWFKGVILYRYFGDLPEGKEYLENVPADDRVSIKKMVFLPIFNSLKSDPVAKLFDNTFVLHNYLDNTVVPRSWGGFKRDNDALVVLGSIHAFEPFQEVMRELIPLTKKIPIKLLGKNVYSKLPADIRNAFAVKTDLDRDEFFNEFFESQFLIYPHARRNHSHNVPIEAIYGGMPIVFRTETPTFIENDHSLMVKAFPGRIGAARSAEGLRSQAIQAYNNEDRLGYLRRVQSRLTTPYSMNNVRNEAAALTAFLKPLIPVRLNNAATSMASSIFSQYPPGELYGNQQAIVSDGSSMLFLNLVSGALAREIVPITFEGSSRHVVKVRSASDKIEVVLGQVLNAESVYFTEDELHRLELEFFSSHSGTCEVSATIIADGKPSLKKTLLLQSQSEQLSMQMAVFDLGMSRPFQVQLSMKARGGSEFYVGKISHRIVGANTKTADLTTEELIFLDSVPSATTIPGSDILAAKIASESDALQIIATNIIDAGLSPCVEFEFEAISSIQSSALVVIEYWSGNSIALRKEFKMNTSGNTVIADDLASQLSLNVRPVVYVLPDKEEEFYVEWIKIRTGPARNAANHTPLNPGMDA